MQAKCNVFASILAAMTKRVKIVLLGNPLPLAENPVRLAEELAMIDMISQGRLVSGFVRGGGQEQLATGVNPAFNRERFEEAHDLDRQGVDAARAVPLGGHALPAPRGEPVGGAAAEAAPARVDPGRAQQGDDHLGGAAALSLHRAQHGDRRDQEDLGALRPGGGRRRATPAVRSTAATCQRCHVAETEEKAMENARQFMWMQGEFTGLAHPVWSTPSGYFSPSYRRPSWSSRSAAARTRAARRSRSRSRTSRSSRARRRP